MFYVETHQRCEFINITEAVRQSLSRAGIRQGIGIVYCPHTTAALTINEAYDPDVAHDILLWLEQHIPQSMAGFRHIERNSDAHIKACLFGNSVTFLVEDGDIVLGQWQGIFFCEFDGPRQRRLQIKWLEDAKK
jgi:secondary thiamine-phosphate synthase enzyme